MLPFAICAHKRYLHWFSAQNVYLYAFEHNNVMSMGWVYSSIRSLDPSPGRRVESTTDGLRSLPFDQPRLASFDHESLREIVRLNTGPGDATDFGSTQKYPTRSN